MVSLSFDILREVLACCDRFDLNELTQTTRQLNQVIQTYFKEKPFIPINCMLRVVNPRILPGAAMMSINNRTSKYFPKYVWHEIENELAEKFFRVRRIELFFNNGFDIDKTVISKLEKISAIGINSVITITFDCGSIFSPGSRTLLPLTDLLSVFTLKCVRLRFNVICEVPVDNSFPLLQYPAFLYYNEIEFTEKFAKYLKKADVIKFLHQKAESQRMNPIRLRIMFPETKWAERLIQKIRFEQATEISPPFHLQLCLSTSVGMKFGSLFRKNSKIGEILRYTVSKHEKLPETSLHTIERASEFK